MFNDLCIKRLPRLGADVRKNFDLEIGSINRVLGRAVVEDKKAFDVLAALRIDWINRLLSFDPVANTGSLLTNNFNSVF